MKKIQVVEKNQWKLRESVKRAKIHSMYSSATGYITTDPELMVIPIDDHLVHRGDGVFESFKCLNGSIYNLDAHLKRMKDSCLAVGISIPTSFNILKDIIVQTVRASQVKESLIRVLVSRGLGTMGIDPSECTGSQFYVIVYKLKKNTNDSSFSSGVKVITSKIPVKPGMFARVKSCNYLPNVLMKKEALDSGVDFSVSIDEEGCLGEGATENFGIVTNDNRLLMPPPDRVLAGTTAKRIMLISQTLVRKGILLEASYKPIPMEIVKDAVEMHVYGTTPNITSVIELDGVKVGSGLPGPIAKYLYEQMKVEMLPKSELLTKVFD